MIEISNLKKSFGDHVIFQDFSLTIPDKEFVVFNGPSGCGKTTLLNMIGGIEPIDSGSIIVDGLNIFNHRSLRKYFQEHVGFLFQNFALVENKTVEENLHMIRENARKNISVQEALKRVGMAGTEKQKVFTLSGGEQQRIALARLIMKKCTLILADEPTGSLDKDNAAQVMQLLLDMNRDGKTVIMVTHDVSFMSIGTKSIELRPHN